MQLQVRVAPQQGYLDYLNTGHNSQTVHTSPHYPRFLSGGEQEYFANADRVTRGERLFHRLEKYSVFLEENLKARFRLSLTHSSCRRPRRVCASCTLLGWTCLLPSDRGKMIDANSFCGFLLT